MDSVQLGMNAAQQFVVVKAPIARVYEQWSRIEDLPRFITSLREVRRIDDTHFSYVWYPNGQDKQGVFEIVLQVPRRRIAWRTMSNGFMSGMVCFEPRSQNETEVDRKSTRLNSSHSQISYAVFCLKKKNSNVQLFFLYTYCNVKQWT